MDKIDELLTRGVDKIYPSKEELDKVLRSGKKLRLYQGFDPTGTKLHVGHMVGLRKLAEWQKLGHEVIFLIGDGTGQAGDPSGKTTARDKFHSREELRANARDYVMQAQKIVDFEGSNPIKILYNGDWLNELKLVDILNIAENFSLQQLSERDMYQERMKKGETVNLREFLYPLLQGYDSVAMDVDLELGGSDQTFNMLCGRTLMKSMKKKEKFVMTTPLLADSSGRKIGKTEGNAIALDDKPEELFGKIMTFPDEVIVKCFECLTTIPMEEVKTVEEKIKEGVNPMLYKKQLAEQIVKELNDEASAKKAALSWSDTFQKGEIPEEMTEVPQVENLMNSLVKAKAVSSNSEFRRLVEEGAITNLETGEKIKDVNFTPEKGSRFKIGKHRFVKII
ncbi:tyrosine--tRNA ligase [Candidatus Nomurabacteria bacterium]|nr:tyrosine--tRNA ligase [Candidatus Nomurabacteria bacterium]